MGTVHEKLSHAIASKMYKNYLNSFLDQEQTDDTTSNTEQTETQNASEERLLERQYNDLLSELNQNTQDKYFKCQMECNTHTGGYIFSTSCKINIWVLSLTLITKQTLDHMNTFSPPHLEIDLLIDSQATLKVLNNDTWNENKEYFKLQMEALKLVLSAANTSKLQSNETVKLTLYPDVTENRTYQNNNFTLNFDVSNTNLILYHSEENP